MDVHEPVPVYASSDAIAAKLVKNALEAEGIRAFVEGANQAALPGLSALEVRVFVDAGHADKARKIIDTLEDNREE
jgi:hypothetical protein